MTIYVDDMYRLPMGRLGRMKMSHMISCGSENELHRFAYQLGMKRAWFQPGPYPHYDVSLESRRIAVSLGAIEVTTRQCVSISHLVKLRIFHPKMSPTDAESVRKILFRINSERSRAMQIASQTSGGLPSPEVSECPIVVLHRHFEQYMPHLKALVEPHHPETCYACEQVALQEASS